MRSSVSAGVNELVDRLGRRVVLDPDIVSAHSTDQAASHRPGTAAALVRAQDRDDVVAVLDIAQRHRMPVVPQGARTGLSGGAGAVDGAVLLSVAAMREVIHIDPTEQTAVVQPGVLNSEISQAAAEYGLWYPPDPASRDISTIGGNVATNAGGLCCVKYGVTRDWLRSLELVLPGGEVLRTGHTTAKGVTGYDLASLVCGSQGTLGTVTEVTVALRAKPPPLLTAVASFGTLEQAAETVAALLREVRPALCELMDTVSLRAVEALTPAGLPSEGALLLVGSDAAEQAASELATFARLSAAHNGYDVIVAEDNFDSEALTKVRRSLHPALERLGTLMVEDVCVPRARFAEFVLGVEAIAGGTDLIVACPGHAGDGNTHPTIIYDGTDQNQIREAERVFDALMEWGLKCGGTVSGEHGTGRIKAAWARKEVGVVAERLQQEIKAVFDPYGIMNPEVF